MRLFNPFDFFFAQDGEVNNAVSYLRECVNTHDTEEFPADTGDLELRRIPAAPESRAEPSAFRRSLEELRRRIVGH